MSEWKLVDVEGIGSGYACLTLDGVSTTKSRNLIQADRGAGGDGLGFSDLGTLLIDYADRDIAGVVGITGDQGGIREDVVGRSDVHIISGVEFCSARPIDTRGDTFSRCCRFILRSNRFRCSGGADSVRKDLSGAQSPSLCVQHGAAHGRSHAAPSCRLYPGSNGADEGTVNESVYEAGAQAAGLYRCWSETDRVEGLDGSGEGSADGDRSAA